MAEHAAKKHLSKFDEFKTYEKLLTVTKELISDILQEKFSLSIFNQKLQRIVSTITAEVHNREKYYFRLISCVSSQDLFEIHSINSAIISFAIYSLLNKEKTKCSPLIKASLLHDIGKLNFPSAISTVHLKPLITDKIEKKTVHILYGQRLLLNHLKMPQKIIKLAGNHHEQYDGTGYPRGISGNDLTMNDYILITSNIASNIIDKLKHNGIKALSETLKMIILKYPEKLEPSIKSILIELLEIQGKAARKYTRFKSDIKTVIMNVTSDTEYHCNVKDISTGGIRISVDRELPKDAIYKIELDLNSILSIGSKFCSIIWHEKTGEHYEYGISFASPDNKITDECSRYLEELEQ